MKTLKLSALFFALTIIFSCNKNNDDNNNVANGKLRDKEIRFKFY